MRWGPKEDAELGGGDMIHPTSLQDHSGGCEQREGSAARAGAGRQAGGPPRCHKHEMTMVRRGRVCQG